MASLKNVLLLGGAGILGPSIITALLEAGTFNVSVLSRPNSRSTFAAGVNKLTSDFAPASLVDSFKGQDVVVDLLAQASVDVHKSFIDAAIDAGVKRFIPSEFSGNMNNEHNVAIITLFADRVTIRDYLKVKSTENAWFSYTTVSTGPFYDWALKASFIGFDISSQNATIYDDGNQPFSVT